MDKIRVLLENLCYTVVFIIICFISILIIITPRILKKINIELNNQTDKLTLKENAYIFFSLIYATSLANVVFFIYKNIDKLIPFIKLILSILFALGFWKTIALALVYLIVIPILNIILKYKNLSNRRKRLNIILVIGLLGLAILFMSSFMQSN